MDTNACERVVPNALASDSLSSAWDKPIHFGFVFIRVHSWLRRCLSARGQRRAQMPNFVFYIARVFDGLRDFLADEPAITTPQIVKLFFYRRLCYPKSRSQTLIRNICRAPW